MNKKEDIIKKVYFDPSGYSSKKVTLEDAKKIDKSIKMKDVDDFFAKYVEKKTKQYGQNSYVAPEAYYEYEVDLFFSLVSQIGNSHVDIEDVFIIGLKGEIIYRIFDFENKDYSIKKGDMIFIPKSIKHKAIGINPRIIVSIGFYGERK